MSVSVRTRRNLVHDILPELNWFILPPLWLLLVDTIVASQLANYLSAHHLHLDFTFIQFLKPNQQNIFCLTRDLYSQATATEQHVQVWITSEWKVWVNDQSKDVHERYHWREILSCKYSDLWTFPRQKKKRIAKKSLNFVQVVLVGNFQFSHVQIFSSQPRRKKFCAFRATNSWFRFLCVWKFPPQAKFQSFQLKLENKKLDNHLSFMLLIIPNGVLRVGDWKQFNDGN